MRYLPHTPQDRQAMLKKIGVNDIDALYAHVPTAKRAPYNFPLANHLGEAQVESLLNKLAERNHSAVDGPFFLGAGCYHHHVPASVDYIIQRSEFMTAYTPYQPEIAQGTLTYLFEFQSYVARLFGQDIANASMYDGATATAEAALMARRITKRNNVTIAGSLHPHTQEVIQTYLGQLGGQITTDTNSDTACIIVSYPGFNGEVPDLTVLRAKADAIGALLVVTVPEIIALGLLPAPSMADIVTGEGQSIGVGMNFGGPHLGLFACKETYLRQMPGRLCGQTVDADGKRSFTLTLSTREQHIRREKATSNICTNQGLCALAFTVHLSLLGETGFIKLAQLNHQKACQLADALSKVKGVKVLNQTFFNEFVVELPTNAKALVEQLATKGIIAGYPMGEKQLLVTATELTTDEHISTFTTALQEVL